MSAETTKYRDADVRALVEAAQAFATKYLLDERDDAGLCMDREHHEDVCALFDALAPFAALPGAGQTQEVR